MSVLRAVLEWHVRIGVSLAINFGNLVFYKASKDVIRNFTQSFVLSQLYRSHNISIVLVGSAFQLLNGNFFKNDELFLRFVTLSVSIFQLIRDNIFKNDELFLRFVSPGAPIAH